MKIKKILIVLLLSVFIIPIVAKAGTISTLDATASGNKIKISGTTNNVHAIAALVYSDNNLVYMGSCSVNDNHNYSCTLNTTFKNGKYTVKVADYAGGAYVSDDVVISVSSGGSSSSYSVVATENTTEDNMAKDIVSNLIIDILANKETPLTEEQTKAIKDAINEGKTLEVGVGSVVIEEKNIVSDANKVKELAKNILKYLDINFIIKDKATGKEITRLTILPKNVKIIIDTPSNLPEVKKGYERVFFIIRVHNNKAERLNTTNNGNNTLSFETDRFSTYALAYEDVLIDATLDKNPKTKGDSFLKYIIPLIISLGTITIVSKKIKA